MLSDVEPRHEYALTANCLARKQTAVRAGPQKHLSGSPPNRGRLITVHPLPYTVLMHAPASTRRARNSNLMCSLCLSNSLPKSYSHRSTV
jgi:hypothetical protein